MIVHNVNGSRLTALTNIGLIIIIICLIIITSRGTRWGEIFSVSDLYEIYDNNFN